VATLKRLSYQVQGPWIVGLAEGSERDAVELLELYREAARRLFAGRDEETDAVLALWESVQRSFSEPALDPLVGVLDWPTKHHLLSLFRESEGLSWADPWLEAQDLEYHQVDEKRGLAFPLASQGYWSCEGAGELDRLATEPPRDTRALARSRVMRRIEEGCEDYVIDWDGVRWDRFWADLSDPHRLEPTLHPLPVGPGASGEETE
jgi:proteasome accessory factor A